MNWELYERQRATLVYVGVVFISILLLAFQRTIAVQSIKAFFVSCTFPTQRLFARWGAPAVPGHIHTSFPDVSTGTLHGSSDTGTLPFSAEGESGNVKTRNVRMLVEENTRLTNLLNLKRERWPNLLAARVVNRDPQRWFQEILLDKGQEEGVKVDDPVIAVVDQREALVGRIVEAGAHTSRAMLIYDSLSAVAASIVERNPADGVAEGSNSHDIYLKYLSRDSQVKIGDSVVTSGLGHMFPPGIMIGWVQDIQLDERQLFLQARLSSALASIPLREVGILIRRE